MKYLIDIAPWVGITLVVWFFLYRRLRNQLISPSQLAALKDNHGRLPPVLDGQCPARPLPVETHEWRDEPSGYSCIMRVYSGAGENRPFVAITLLAPSNGEFFLLARETAKKSNFANRLLSQEPTFIPDATLHSRFKLFATAEVAAAISEPRIAAALTKLADMGYSAIRKDSLGIDALWFQCPEISGVSPEIREAALLSLREIAGAFADRPASLHTPARVQYLQLLYFAVAGAIPISIALIAARVAQSATVQYDPLSSEFGRTFLVGLPVALVLVAIVMLAQQRLLRNVLPRVGLWAILIFSAYIVGMFGIQLTVLANCAFDRSAATTHEVADLSVNAGSRPGRCSIAVESWISGVKTERIPLDGFQCELLPADAKWSADGPKLRIKTKPGLFGIEWIVPESVMFVESTSD